jgi:hypothetical protein
LRVIDGEVDPISGAHMVERYRQLIADADTVLLPGIGHYPQIEAPVQVLKHYLAFRDRLELPPQGGVLLRSKDRSLRQLLHKLMQELPQAAIFDLLTPSSSPTLIAHHSASAVFVVTQSPVPDTRTQYWPAGVLR